MTGYLIDRSRALRTDDIVAVVSVRQRRGRSRVILRDNSLYQTLTRPKTLMQRTRQQTEESRNTTWPKPQ